MPCLVLVPQQPGCLANRPFTPVRSSPPAMSPRVAAPSLVSGVYGWRRRRPTTQRATKELCLRCGAMGLGVSASVGRATAKRVEVPGVRSGSRGRSANGWHALTQGVLIATFRFAATARRGAFADGRRIVGGDEGGRQTLIQPHGAVRFER